MTWMIKLARYNEITASAFGILLNLLLIYIVCTVKSKVGNISRILLQNCFLDITLAVATFLAGVHPFIINRIYYIVIGSWLNVYGFECASFLIAFYGASVILSIQALPVPFYVRYQILCKDKMVTLKQFIILYGILFCAFVIMFCLALWCYPRNQSFYEPFKNVTMTEYWLEEFPNGPTFLARKIGDIELISFVGFALITSAVSYSLVLYYSIGISRHLSHHTNTFKQTKIPNKQLHRTLIAQAFGPLIVGNGPIFLLIVMIFVGIENSNASIVLSSMFGYVGVVNPLAALIIIAPYRNHITQIFKIRHTASIHANAIVSIPNTKSSTRAMPNILLPQ